MGYFTGTATSYADIKSAIEAAALDAGYSFSSDIFSKNGCFYKFAVFATGLALEMGTGQSGSSLTNPLNSNWRPFINVALPCTYEIFTFSNPDELHCVLNYSSDFYQFMAFGKSDIPGIGGTGGWGSASMVSNNSIGTNITSLTISNSNSGTDGSTGSRMTGPYFTARGANAVYGATSINLGIDSLGWYKPSGVQYCSSLLSALPNLFNESTILLPVKGIAERSSGGKTIVANLRNVRYCRIDNIEPKQVITLGAESWKIYPMLRKDLINRNGGGNNSGTLGYAINASELI